MTGQSRSRVHRGMRSQKVVAQYLEENGFPWAESTGSGRSGVDITGVPGLALEVKARAKLEPQAWLRQAEREDAGMPAVIFRLNGVGEANVGSWGVMMRLDVWTNLIREAGYGDPLVKEAGDREADPVVRDQPVDPDPQAAEDYVGDETHEGPQGNRGKPLTQSGSRSEVQQSHESEPKA